MFVSLHEALDHLDAALDTASHITPGGLSREELTEWLGALQQRRARLDALAVRAAGAADDASIALLGRTRSTSAHLASVTNTSPATVAADISLGHWLARFATFGEAFDDGTISRAHLHALRSLSTPRTNAALSDAQDYLVHAAQHCSWRDFMIVITEWRRHADQDGPPPHEQYQRRGMGWNRDTDGTIKGWFRLDPLTGTAVTTAIDNELQRHYRNTTDRTGSGESSGEGGGDGAGDEGSGEGSGPPLSLAQRRADALAALLCRGATRPDGTSPTPLIHILLSAQILAHYLDADARDEAVHLDRRDPDATCHLVDGTPLDPRLVLTALSHSELRRLVLGPDREILDLGQRTRLFPPHLKAALLAAAHGRCNTPGCDAPLHWLEADHVHPYRHGGATATANGQILCNPHNRAKRDQVPPPPRSPGARSPRPPGPPPSGPRPKSPDTPPRAGPRQPPDAASPDDP